MGFIAKGIDGLLDLKWFETSSDEVEGPQPLATFSAGDYFASSNNLCGSGFIGCFDNNDFVSYGPVNFGPSGTTKSIRIEFSKGTQTGKLEARLGGPEGDLLGVFEPWYTGGFHIFVFDAFA